MRRILLSLALAVVLRAQSPCVTVGKVVVCTVQGLECGLRIFQGDQVQAYCFYNAPPAAPLLVHNEVFTLSRLSTSGPQGLPFQSYATTGYGYSVDSTTTLFVIWLVWGGTNFQYQAIMGTCSGFGTPTPACNNLPMASGTLQ